MKAFAPKLFRGGRPRREFDVLMLNREKIKTVVSLESGLADLFDSHFRERALLKKHGIAFLRVKMSPVLPPGRREILRALRILQDESLKPIYLHCYSGVDRTGTVAAVYEVIYGSPPFQAFKGMLASGFHWVRFGWWLPYILWLLFLASKKR